MRAFQRRIFLMFFTAWMGLIPAENVFAQEDSGIPIGERLEYKITWLGIPVGTGELWAKEKITLDGREVFHVVGMIRTNKVLSKIFPMYDEAQSWIDVKSLEAVQFEKKVDELFLHQHERNRFDREKKKGYFESFKSGEKREFEIAVPVHDVLSAVYWARRQRLEPGVSVKTILSCDQKDWHLDIHAERRETVKLHGKKVETLRVEPTTVSEGVERRGKAWFYVTDDSTQTPVKIIYKAPIGRMVGTLKETPLAALTKAE